jgi:hypothetical protein
MEYFSNILKEFNSKQKLFVLVLLLLFTSTTAIITTYYNSGYNSCKEIVKENRELLEDYILISKLIRDEEKKKHYPLIMDSMSVTESRDDRNLPRASSPEYEEVNLMDSILHITDRHLK